MSATEPAMFFRPTVSMSSSGAPMPAPTYGVSEPDEYHSAVRSRESAFTAASSARCAVSSAVSSARKIVETSPISAKMSSKPSFAGLYAGSSQAEGET